jgi:hypothetical protein
MFFRRKQPQQPESGPRIRIELVEYIDQETGKKHWDVRKHHRFPVSGWIFHSLTDDYGFDDIEKARAAYTRQLAIERGELKVGMAKYTIAEVEIP